MRDPGFLDLSSARPLAREYGRPRTIGEVLDPRARGAVPKPLPLIRLRSDGSRWGVYERRLLNVLLGLAWPWLGRQAFEGRFQIPAVQLREAIGQGRLHDNRWLRRALHNLLNDPVRMDEAGSLAGPRRYGEPVRLLASATMTDGGTIVRWAFSDQVVALCRAPAVWGYVDLGICRILERGDDLVLYENLALGARLKRPTWSVELADLFGDLGRAERPRWSDFRHNLLEPAFARISSLMKREASFLGVRERGTRCIRWLEFSLGPDARGGRAGRARQAPAR